MGRNKWNAFAKLVPGTKPMGRKNETVNDDVKVVNGLLMTRAGKGVSMERFGLAFVSTSVQVRSGNMVSHKKSWHVYAKYKKLWVDAIGFELKGRELAPGYRVSVNIKRYTSGRFFDDANFRQGCKPILDVLVGMKYMYDDSPKWLVDTYQQIKCGKGEERTVIEVIG